jgi:cell division GTPase FtsZ
MQGLTPIIGTVALDAFGRSVIDILGSKGDGDSRFLGIIDDHPKSAWDDVHLLFIVGRVSEAERAADVARVARDRGVLSLALIALPPLLGNARRDVGRDAPLRSLEDAVDAVFPLSADGEATAAALAVDTVRTIAHVLLEPGLVQFDYADLVAVLGDRGQGRIATGRASGADRTRRAAQRLLASPLLMGRDFRDFVACLLIARVAPDVTIEELYAGIENLGFTADDHRIWTWQALPLTGSGAEIEVTGLLAGRRNHG